MELGMIGLGKMGANMTRRLTKGGHKVVVFDRSADAIATLASEGATGATSLSDMLTKLNAPRAVWIMVPSGDPTEATIKAIVALLQPGDVIIDGGNSNYKDSMRRAAALAPTRDSLPRCRHQRRRVGPGEGYALMVGGDDPRGRSLSQSSRRLRPAPMTRAGAMSARLGPDISRR